MTNKDPKILENGLQGARILKPEARQSFAQDGLHGAEKLLLKPQPQPKKDDKKK
jgi:hypothetical protein